MSILRGSMIRRKSCGTLQERVSADLKRLNEMRANKAACSHRFSYSPAVRGSICIDCGKRGS